jgi:arginyl-tRNA synthetase
MIQASLAQHVLSALEKAQAAQEIPLENLPNEIKIETPRDPAHGDYATNLALSLAKEAKMAPRKLAEVLLPHLASPQFQEISIAGPGFINFRLSQDWLLEQLKSLLNVGDDFGKQSNPDSHTYLIEYVSANPTGPLHFGHGRWAVLGDCLARLMRLAGYQVKTEFYINDTGAQINNLGESVRACYLQAVSAAGEEVSASAQALISEYQAEKTATEKGKVRFYHGQYIQTLGQTLYENQQASQIDAGSAYFSEYAKAAILAEQQHQLQQFGVVFDEWFPESRLHHEEAVAEALRHLKESGKTYEQDGALWFRSTDYGDDQDRVLVKQTGSKTYFANDIAYHWDKLRRGHERLINIWGADHHGYIARMRAAIQALGYPAEALEVLLGQMVNLYRNGEKVRMSKRTGDMVSFGEVLEEVGTDATRFLLMQRSADVTLDFDLELAKSENSENPVFYVQYAHARICSVFRNAERVTRYNALAWEGTDLSVLTAPEERNLLLKLLSYPDELRFAALQREPHRLATYAQELAALFHSFYRQCRVLFEKKAEDIVTEEEIAISLARLNLAKGCQIVLRNVLVDVFGISAPEIM